jgi:hypothetical protein
MDAVRDIGLDRAEWTMTRLLVGAAIQAGEEIWLLRAKQLSDEANVVINKFARMRVEVGFKSMYGEQLPLFSTPLGSEDLLVSELSSATPKRARRRGARGSKPNNA